MAMYGRAHRAEHMRCLVLAFMDIFHGRVMNEVVTMLRVMSGQTL